MIFADEARFTKHTVAACGDGLAALVKTVQTDVHLGPGSYFTEAREAERGGWKRRSFSKREPFSPGSRIVDRNHHYTAGLLLPSGGIAVAAVSPSAGLSSPGPGHYIGQKPFYSPNKSSSKTSLMGGDSTINSTHSRPRSAGGSLGRSGMSGSSSRPSLGSPRLAGPHAVVREGILFHSKPGTDSGVGPGYYSPVSSSFITKSFNARVNKNSSKSGASPKSAASPSPKSRTGGSPSARSQGDASFSVAPYPFDTF